MMTPAEEFKAMQLFVDGYSRGMVERIETEMQRDLVSERARDEFWRQMLLRVAEKFPLGKDR